MRNANTEVLSVTFIHSVHKHGLFPIPTSTVKGQLYILLYTDNSNLNMPGQASDAEVKRVHTIRLSQHLKQGCSTKLPTRNGYWTTFGNLRENIIQLRMDTHQELF